MNLYLVSQSAPKGESFYAQFVVAADTPEEACSIHLTRQLIRADDAGHCSDQTTIENTIAELIGAAPKGTKAGASYFS